MKKVIRKGARVIMLLVILAILIFSVNALMLTVENIIKKHDNFETNITTCYNPDFSEEQYERHLERLAATVVERPTVIKQTVKYIEPTTIYIDDLVHTEPIEEIIEPDIQESMYTDDDLFCLAAVVYQEAGSDACSDDTRQKVADVVLNRVLDDRFPDTIRGVLEEPKQYGMFWSTGVCFPERANDDSEKHAVKRAYDIARGVLEGNHSSLFEQGYVWQAEFGQGYEGFWQDEIYFGR